MRKRTLTVIAIRDPRMRSRCTLYSGKEREDEDGEKKGRTVACPAWMKFKPTTVYLSMN